MPIGPEKLHALVRDPKIKLLENLDRRELENAEGAGFDLRIGEIYEIDYLGTAFLGVKDRQTPETRRLAIYNKRKKTEFSVVPNKYLLIKTLEKVNLPKDIAGYTFSRTTLFRSGLQLLCTQIQPGYKGELIFGLVNLGPVPVTIELGARVAHVQFEYVDGGGAEYRGQWQGGRVSTGGKREKQI